MKSVQVAHSSVCNTQLSPHSSASVEIILISRPSADWSQMSNKVRGTSVKVLPNGIVVHSSCCGHKQVPDGMGKWNDAIALEEHNSQAVNQASAGKLLKSVRVILSTKGKVKKKKKKGLMLLQCDKVTVAILPLKAPGFLHNQE